LADVEQLAEVQTIVAEFNKTDAGAAEAAAKRAAVEILVDKLYKADADATVKKAEAETVKKQLQVVKEKLDANEALREVERAKVIKVEKELEQDHKQQRMCGMKIERLTLRKERADKAAENADMIVEDKKKALVVNEAENAAAELEAAIELSETLVRQEKSRTAVLARTKTAIDLAIAKIDKVQIDAGLDNEFVNLSTENEIKQKAAAAANDLLQIAAVERQKGDDEVTTIEDIVAANTKVFTAAKLTEKFDQFIAEDKANNDKYTKLEKDLELNHEKTTLATLSNDTAALGTLAAELAAIETAMPALETALTQAEEKKAQLELAKTEYDAASTIAVNLTNARMKLQNQQDKVELIEENIKAAEVVKVEMDARTDPEMATALLVAKEEARVEEAKKASTKAQQEAAKLAAKIPSVHDTALATETAAIQATVDQTTKVALHLAKNVVNAQEAIKKIEKEKIEAAKQAEKARQEAEEVELEMEIVKLEAEKARDALAKVKNIADMPSAQKKTDEAEAKEAELLRAQQLQAAAKLKADRELLEREKRAAAAAELAKRTALAKAKADKAKA